MVLIAVAAFMRRGGFIAVFRGLFAAAVMRRRSPALVASPAAVLLLLLDVGFGVGERFLAQDSFPGLGVLLFPLFQRLWITLDNLN